MLFNSKTKIMCRGYSITDEAPGTDPYPTSTYCNLLKSSLTSARPDIKWTTVKDAKPSAYSTYLLQHWGDCGKSSGVDLMILMIGSNDVLFNIPLSTYESNMTKMINTCKSNNVDLILLTVPPTKGLDTRRNNDILRTFAEKIRELGIKHSIDVVDVWDELWQYWGTETFNTYFFDNVHFNNAGHKLIHDLLKPVILGDGDSDTLEKGVKSSSGSSNKNDMYGK